MGVRGSRLKVKGGGVYLGTWLVGGGGWELEGWGWVGEGWGVSVRDGFDGCRLAKLVSALLSIDNCESVMRCE